LGFKGLTLYIATLCWFHEAFLCTVYRVILSLNLEWPWHETDNSPPSSAEVKHDAFMAWHFLASGHHVSITMLGREGCGSVSAFSCLIMPHCSKLAVV